MLLKKYTNNAVDYLRQELCKDFSSWSTPSSDQLFVGQLGQNSNPSPNQTCQVSNYKSAIWISLLQPTEKPPHFTQKTAVVSTVDIRCHKCLMLPNVMSNNSFRNSDIPSKQAAETHSIVHPKFSTLTF